MTKLSKTAFANKWNPRFAPNEFQNITEATFQELVMDVKDSFAGEGQVSFQSLVGLALDNVDLANTLEQYATTLYVDAANAEQQAELDLLDERVTQAENDADALDLRVDALESGGGSAQRTGTVLVFDQDADYAEIAAGTFTVDLTGQTAGVTTARLAASCTAIALPSANFTRLGAGDFVPGAANFYCFLSFGPGSKIFYTVSPHA